MAEKGTHAELMAKQGLYYSLAISQVMFMWHNAMLARLVFSFLTFQNSYDRSPES